MNRSKYIFLKLSLLLMLVVGWSGSAWAQDFPRVGKIYTIQATFANSANNSYLTNDNSTLTFPTAPTKSGSYWRVVSSGDTTYPWKFQSVADDTKYLNASESSGIGATATNFAFPPSISGTYYLNGKINGDNRSLYIGTWGIGDSRSGFGRSGNGGCWGTAHANNNWTTDYQLVECVLLNGNTNIKFVDENGTTLSQGEVNFTQNGSVVKINTSTYTFGDIACPVSAFSSADQEKHLDNVNYDANTNTLTFVLSDIIPEWYTIKHNYDPGNANHRRYLHLMDNGNLEYVVTNTGDYSCIWKFEDRTGNGGVNFVSAKLGNGMVMSAGNADRQATMNPVGGPYTYGSYDFTKTQNGSIWWLRDKNNQSLYFGMSGFNARVRTRTDASVDLVLTRVPNMGKNVRIVVNGSNEILYNTQCEALTDEHDIKLKDGDYHNFHNMPYLPSLFTTADMGKRITSVQFDEESQTLTFTVGDEEWFTIKNHRRDNGYLSVSATGLNNTQQMQWGITSATANTVAEYWCMKEDGSGMRIYNKAYGWDYVLGIENTSSGSRVRMYHISEANAANTHFDKVNSNTSGEYCIMLHSNHGIALHDYSTQLGIWNNNNENQHKGDVGSAFIFTPIEKTVIDAIPEYTVYKVDVKTGSQAAKFGGDASNIIGQRSVLDGLYIVLKSDYTPNADDFNFPELTLSDSTTDPVYKILTLTGEEKVPNIIHKKAYFYTKLETEPNKPVYGHIGTLEADDDGLSLRADGIKEQKTSVFEIPVYLQPGNHPRNLYLPSDKLQWYQRWYNYETDGLVDRGVMPALYTDNYVMYKNGHVSGAINGSNGKGYMTTPQLYLPESLPTEEINGKTFYKDYLLTMDISRYKDNSTLGNDFVEPTLSQRVIYRIMDANKIATEIKAKTEAGDWYEKREIIFPCKKRGEQSNNNTGADLVPLDMDLWNYWGYNSANQLVQLTGDGQITVELAPESTAQLAQYGLINGRGGISRVDFNRGHFITFTYPTGNVAPDNSTAILNVYFTAGGTRYNLAQFTLTFQPNVEPKLITDVIGKSGDGFISSRSPHAMTVDYGKPIAQLQFDNTMVDMVAPEGGVDHYNEWRGWTSRGEYAYPLDFSMSSYGYGYGSDSGTSRGEYGIFKFSQATGGHSYKYYPVKKYFDNILKPGDEDREFVENDDYIIYVDAADQAGQVMSIPIAGGLCPGTRLYCYGWMASNAGGSNPASVILSIVGHKSDGTTKVLTSYCPGILSAWGYRDEDDARSYSFDPTTGSATIEHGPNDNWGLWQQIGFSFMLDKQVLDTYTNFSMLVYNNCYNSSGGDYLLDNFQIFANPPKGEVDFTTPLCSDKIRHAKVHSDFDMLKNLSGVNEEDPTAEITTTYCFLDAELFDSVEEDGLKISEMFEMDDKGNHSLKPIYSDSDPKVINIINHAFRMALVGSRYTKESGKEDHGFHTYTIPTDFTAIPPYAYNDSKTEIVYRETDASGVRRLVFKENIMRGEMEMVPAEPGKEDIHPAYWPYMRPSRTYYLVFSPILASQTAIDNANTATDIFHIHESCSFFGKFTTKDPMHVILDNADIESDLPIQAVCHGETVALRFDMPAMKADKPIVDEAYCTSDESLNGKVVPASQGTHHYRYEPMFKSEAVYGVIKNLPYDWWIGGKLGGATYRGDIEEYLTATHPTRTYSGPKDIAHKQDGALVKVAQAMTDFRFFYPEFGKGGGTLDWSTVTRKEYNSNTGYGLLDSEIATIKDFVDAGIITLYRDTYNMPLTYEEAEELQAKELNEMMEDEMSKQILELALTLNKDPEIAAMLPLKQLEAKVIEELSIDGKKRLTYEEFGNFTREQLVDIAGELKNQGKLSVDVYNKISTMSDGNLRSTVEAVLRAMSDSEMLMFAKDYFPNIGHEKRAYLIVRALNILSRETVAKLPEADQQNTAKVRAALRAEMIEVFSAQNPVVLRKMWSDVSAELTPKEREALLGDKDPATMDAPGLAVLVEDGLAQITNNVINEMKADRYVHFTLVPIMPSQENFVDEPYIFCPDPRGVRIRITSNEPKMLDGFVEMPYPEEMDNVPVRLGLTQISESKANASKTLRIPVRGLKQATKNGVKAVRVIDTGYQDNIFLVETNDPAYQQTQSETISEAKNSDGIYLQMIGKITDIKASYPTEEQPMPDNYLVVKFANDMNFREGYIYRVGINYMEVDGSKEEKPTISCYGTMLFDLRIVPEYQRWASEYSSDWTNDHNWMRADRNELNADNKASDNTKPLEAYLSNEANETAASFVPMYFTNVLVDGKVPGPELYDGLTPASRAERKFLAGLKATATNDIIYDMEVEPSTGAWHTDGNYECGLFGTYIANGITFKPASQLINAHLLTYNKAWVEYELKTGRWYTLASPLQNTFAGEWYSPTDGGKQMTPHFYPITYQQGEGSNNLNDRFRPAYYQRSWDSEGNNPVYLKTGGMQEAYIMADWSYVYNDVKKEYSNGGFSVMVDDSHMSSAIAEGKALNRMPKADVEYTYFDIDGNTAAVAKTDQLSVSGKRNRLWSDELKTSETFTQSIENKTSGNNFFLVANPFMANMDMDAFFAKNTDLEKKYWIMTEGGQDVNVKVDGSQWIGSAEGKKVAPLQGFFVKRSDNANSLTVTYDATMQAEATATEQLKAKGLQQATPAALTITARHGETTSTAIVVLRDGASNDFVSTEDCETFIDSNTAKVPTLYTVASGQAMTVNTVPQIDMLPLGVTCEEDGFVEVSFAGIEGSLYLYDAQNAQTHKLSADDVVTLPTNTSGRYFITMKDVTGIDAVMLDGDSEGPAYDVSGKRVITPRRGTIVIVDGKKRLIKK